MRTQTRIGTLWVALEFDVDDAGRRSKQLKKTDEDRS